MRKVNCMNTSINILFHFATFCYIKKKLIKLNCYYKNNRYIKREKKKHVCNKYTILANRLGYFELLFNLNITF